MLNTRTKKKHLQKKDLLKKKRKTSKHRYFVGSGILDSTKENIISVGKNVTNTLSNPLTSFRKGANYLKNKGKFALTYLVNTSDLDRIVYKNSNFIHLVPTEILNNIYYENEVKEGESEIAYAARRTSAAVGTLAKNTRDAAIKAKDVAKEAAIKAAEAATKAKDVALRGLNVVKDEGAKALSSVWKAINETGTRNRDNDITNGKFETSLGAVGRKLDNVQLSLDFDQQPGLSKPSMKKQTWVEATYDKSNVLNNVLNEVLTANTGYVNANVADVLGDYFREVEEDLALISKSASASNKRKRKKGKGQNKEKKILAFENEISKEQKYEIPKGMLEILYDLVIKDTTNPEILDFKNVLLFLTAEHLKSNTFLQNPGSRPTFEVRKDIESVVEDEGDVSGGGKGKRKGKRSSSKKKKQIGGTIKIDGTKIDNIVSLLSPEEGELQNVCTIADGSQVDSILTDLNRMLEDEETEKYKFSLLFFDINIWDDNDKKNMENIQNIIKENGIIVGDPVFTFGQWELKATFKIKGFDDKYGIFVKDIKHFYPITGIDMEKENAKQVIKEVEGEGKVDGKVDENGNVNGKVDETVINNNNNRNGEEDENTGVKLNNNSSSDNLKPNTNELADIITKIAVLQLKDILEKKKEKSHVTSSTSDNNQNDINESNQTQEQISQQKIKQNVPPLELSQIQSSEREESTKKVVKSNVPVEFTTEVLKVGGTNEKDGLEIPLPFLKVLSKKPSDSDNKTDRTSSSSINNESSKELLRQMIQPQIIKERIETNTRFLDILDKIINESHCGNLKKNETKSECFTTYAKKLISTLNLDTGSEEIKIELESKEKDEKENELLKSYTKYPISNKLTPSPSSKTIRSSTSSSSSTISSSKSTTISEWFQEIRSDLQAEIVKSNTPDNSANKDGSISSIRSREKGDSSVLTDFTNVNNQKTFTEKISEINKQIK